MCVCVCVCVCVYISTSLTGSTPFKKSLQEKKTHFRKKKCPSRKKNIHLFDRVDALQEISSGKKNVLQEKKDALQEKKRSTSLIGSMPFKKSHGKASACLLAGPQLYTCAQEQIFYRVKNNLQGQIIHKYRYLRISFRTGVI